MTQPVDDLGLHFVVGLSGPKITSEESDALARISPIGIILFAKNIDSESDQWISTLQELIHDAKQASGRDHLLVSVDHEGGRVHRFPESVTHFPYARKWAGCAFDVGVAMGKELRALGFNLSFAPVLDIASEEKEPSDCRTSFL